MALGGALEVLVAKDWLVADVAERFDALLALQIVNGALLLVDFAASRAQHTLLDIDSWVPSKAQELLDHLGRDLLRQK